MPEAVYHLDPGDKATDITAYTAQSWIRGDLVTREAIRVSTWLRTPGLPEYATMYNARVLRAVGFGDPQFIELEEFHTPVTPIIALHMTPPNEDSIEHDPSEQNRRMVPLTAIAGPFRFDGSLRMPQHLTLAKQMILLRDPFLSLYDVKVVSLFEPDKETKVSMVVLRPQAFAFAPGS
jgi:hypothetical protein